MDGETVVAETTNDAQGNVVFEVNYDKVGEYKYTVVEVIPDDAVQQEDGSFVRNGVTYSTEKIDFTVTVTAEGDKLTAAVAHEGASVTITNIYEAKSVDMVLEAVKVLNGRDLAAEEFSFILTGEGRSETVKNDKDGNIKFSTITYHAVGTYTYTISEVKGDLGGVTYSDVVFTAAVTVTDNGAGLCFCFFL